jgi:hypothetical protein
LDKLIRQLRTLLQALVEGDKVEISGSPVSSILEVCSDLIQAASAAFEENKGVYTGRGLIFEEEKVIDSFEYEQRKDKLFFDIQNYFWSPTDKRYYLYQSDSLGNPKQVNVNFEPSLKFTPSDANKIAKFLKDISTIFISLSLGRIDFAFFRTLHQLFLLSNSNPISSRIPSTEKFKSEDRRHLFNKYQRFKRRQSTGPHSKRKYKTINSDGHKEPFI